MRASVLPQAEPGYATLRISELDALPDGLAISIQRQQGPDSYLADDGWRRTEAWLQPAQVVRLKGVLEFQLGPEICDRLAGIATVRLRVKEPDIGVVGTTVVAWPQMLTSGAVDLSNRNLDDTVRLRGRAVEPPPPPAPPFELPPEPEPAPIPELRAEREPMADEPKSGGARWLIAAVIVLLLAGGGYYAYTNYFQPQEATAAAEPSSVPAPAPPPPAAATPTPIAPKQSMRATVDAYLATNPTPEAMLAKAKEFADAGELNAAFLVWRRAAETGNVPAQVELASFYDPLVTPPKAGFTPDGARAADWYERAALAGNAEAQRKVGLLLAKGGAGLTADQGRAKSWLQQAAAQNDAEAKKALETLPEVKTLAGLLLAIVALPAYGQTAPFACGDFKAESKRVGAETQWTIAHGKEKSSERGALKSGPVFSCVEGAVLAIEFTTSAGNGFVDLRFPDGNEIGYGGQIVRRNNRFVLPIQAKPRIDAKYRAAFDYHCKFVLPGDPIPEASRADCVF